MVAAAKLRRAQQKLVQSRQYGKTLEGLIDRLLASGQDLQHPLLNAVDQPKAAWVFAFTSDRGLCGGFNSNLLRRTDRFLRENKDLYAELLVQTRGRKGCEYYRARKITLSAEYPGIAEKFDYAVAGQFAQRFMEAFTKGEVDEVFIVYNQFKSAISQDIIVKKLLPVALSGAAPKTTGDILWEPDQFSLLDQLLTRYVAMQLYLAHLESQASELGARMSAMDSATNNASDMIDRLTLQMNRARQAAITTELMDIVNGAEAMK